MKTIKLLILFSIVLFAFSCGKKEGVVQYDRKIDHILMSEVRLQEDDTIFTSDDRMSEQWIWDGKKVLRIDYYGDYQYSENFYYDGRQIVRTTVPAYNLRTELEYDGRKLQQIDIYKKDSLSATMSFKRGDKVISEIIIRRIEPDSEALWPMWAPMPLRAIVGNDVAQAICRDAACQTQSARAKGKAGSELHYSLTWKDDNVVRIDARGGEPATYAITLTYDNKQNPYEQLFANHELNESVFGFKMFSHNNVTSVRRPFEKKGIVHFKYAYTYDEDYPISRKLTYSYMAQSAQFDSVTMKVEKTEKYVYQ